MSRIFKANVDNIEDEEQQQQEEEEYDEKNKRGKKRRLLLGGCSYKKAKKVILTPFNKIYSKFDHTRSHTKTSKLGTQGNNSIGGNDDDDDKGSGKFYCCLCFSKPQTLDSGVDGIDLDDINVNSHQSLKDMIEKNDFYSKECNTHFVDGIVDN